ALASKREVKNGPAAKRQTLRPEINAVGRAVERGYTRTQKNTPESATAIRTITVMRVSDSGDWRIALCDGDLLNAVLDFIEEQIDDASEQTRINTIASLPRAQRALAVMSRVWGEVANGGLPQFFYNRPDSRWHTWAVEAAHLMSMPRTGQAL